MNDKFEKFTERARNVLNLAQDEAQRFNHNYIGTEHLLLGLVREGEGIAAGVLESLGVNLEKVRAATIAVLSGGAVSAVTFPAADAPLPASGARITLFSGSRPTARQGNTFQVILLACSLILLGLGVTQMANGIAYGLAESVGVAVTVVTAILGAFCVIQVFGMLLALRDRVVGYLLVGLTALAWIAAMALERARLFGSVAPYRDTMLAQGLNWAVLGLGALVVIEIIALSIFGSARHRQSR